MFDAEQLDIVIVPGVAFSRGGGRMGNGQGYYDRLLDRVRPDCPLVGLCYECQLFDNLIVGPHDVFMDKVVTEQATYEGQGRSQRPVEVLLDVQGCQCPPLSMTPTPRLSAASTSSS